MLPNVLAAVYILPDNGAAEMAPSLVIPGAFTLCPGGRC
jgi:hypothetical protein